MLCAFGYLVRRKPQKMGVFQPLQSAMGGQRQDQWGQDLVQLFDLTFLFNNTQSHIKDARKKSLD